MPPEKQACYLLIRWHFCFLKKGSGGQMHLHKTLHLRLQIIDKASERGMLLKGSHRVK